MSPALLPLLWLLNGILVVAYFIADHLPVALLIPVLVWIGATTPREQRPWFAVAGCLAIVASAIAPPPVPILLLVMAAGGAAAIAIEQFNPAALRWRVTSGLALYALAGLGFALWQKIALSGAPAAGGILERGQSYFNIIVGIAMYAIPLGYLGLLAQAVWAHPPTVAAPDALIHAVRSRGKSE